ncbi:spore coat associated protein CotJA [Orenia metallireducens]|uniref:spore coat associated protein CotJA n=1 Tax=Orenia metallireducens TaxID=1413210 RepID=UPI0009F69BD5|nr:spore coat associated protein CotJA [Orenia metallireducens]
MAHNRPNMEREHYPTPDFELAEAYIPFQNYGRRYNLREALRKGTIFVDLYRPYRRRRI